MTRIDRWIPLVLGAVFIAAGALKIVDPLAFAVSTARLRLVPMSIVGPVAILLPWIEVVAGLALFFPAWRLPAVKLLLGLLAGFTGVLLIGLLRGTGGSCGCFGGSDAFVNRADVAVIRNVVLIALAVVLLRRKPTSPAGPASPASDTGR